MWRMRKISVLSEEDGYISNNALRSSYTSHLLTKYITPLALAALKKNLCMCQKKYAAVKAEKKTSRKMGEADFRGEARLKKFKHVFHFGFALSTNTGI